VLRFDEGGAEQNFLDAERAIRAGSQRAIDRGPPSTVAVGVAVGGGVAVSVSVALGMSVAVAVADAVSIAVGVIVAVSVAVAVGVTQGTTETTHVILKFARRARVVRRCVFPQTRWRAPLPRRLFKRALVAG
jgi:hypothetical protein